MWEFADNHPMWFFVYLSTVCFTVTLVINTILARVFCDEHSARRTKVEETKEKKVE